MKQRISIGVLPSGKAQDFDSCIRWFESSYPSYGDVVQLAERQTVRKWCKKHKEPWATKINFISLLFKYK